MFMLVLASLVSTGKQAVSGSTVSGKESSDFNSEAFYSIMLNGFKRQAEQYEYRFKKASELSDGAVTSYDTVVIRNKVTVSKYNHPRLKSKAVWVTRDEYGNELARASKRKDSVKQAFVTIITQ